MLLLNDLDRIEAPKGTMSDFYPVAAMEDKQKVPIMNIEQNQ
jgi:hypothetical protein